MNKTSAVVFASWCPGPQELEIVSMSFDAIIKTYLNDDIYVGVNYPFYQPWIDKLKSYKNVTIAYVPEKNTIDSDASAIIAALDAMRISGKTYDYVFFGHTKGAASKNKRETELFINNFWIQKDSFINMIDNIAPGVGGIFPYAAPLTHSFTLLQEMCGFKYKPMPLMSTMGFFVTKGEPVAHLLNNAPPEFWSKNLTENGLDRWMLERDMAGIISAYGMVPIPLRIHSHQNVVAGENSYNEILANWSRENGNLWIPRFRYKTVIDPSFTYCPQVWQIEAMNVNNEDIPPVPANAAELIQKQQVIPEEGRVVQPESFEELPSNVVHTTSTHTSSSVPTYVANLAEGFVPTQQRLPQEFYDFLNKKEIERSAQEVQTQTYINTSPVSSGQGPILTEYLSNKEYYDSLTDKEFTHRYLSEIYEDLFAKYPKNFKFLEIGTYKGGMIKLISKAYPECTITGCDIDPKMDYQEWQGPNYQIVRADAYNPKAVEEIKNFFGTFDIIIEDGPHTESTQVFALEHYYDLLNPGGVLIIEDIASMPSAIMMKMKHQDIEIIDLRERNPELYITDNVIAIRRKEA